MRLRTARRGGKLAVLSFLAAVASCRHAGAPAGAPTADALAIGGRDTGEADGPARNERVAVTVDGRERGLLVHVPARLEPAAALVFNLHGSGGTAADEESLSDMDRVADQHGFLVAYAEGAIALGGGFAWNVPGQPLADGTAVPPGSPDDGVFLATAVTALGARYRIDPRRIFVTGMSGGARMASQLACDLSSVIAAAAPVAGLRFPEPCASVRRVPVLTFHGTADAVNPYAGDGAAYWTYGVVTAVDRWAAHDGCDARPLVSQPATGVELRAYAGCADGAAVALYTIAGAGHEWPGGPQQTAALDASAIMWDFFAAHPLPP
jgi:polyhydroxybutyrate depolymerase